MFLYLSLKDLVLLINACCEAADFRRGRSLPCVEKYLAMRHRLDDIYSNFERVVGDTPPCRAHL